MPKAVSTMVSYLYVGMVVVPPGAMDPEMSVVPVMLTLPSTYACPPLNVLLCTLNVTPSVSVRCNPSATGIAAPPRGSSPGTSCQKRYPRQTFALGSLRYSDCISMSGSTWPSQLVKTGAARCVASYG